MKLELSTGSYENLKFDEGCYINVAITNNSETFPLHWHAVTEIIMPLEGSLEIEINNKPYTLNEHDLLFTSIGELGFPILNSNNNFRILSFSALFSF